MTFSQFWDSMDNGIKMALVAAVITIIWLVDRTLKAKGETLIETEKNKTEREKNETDTRAYILDLASANGKRIDELNIQVESLRAQLLDMAKEKSYTEGQYAQMSKQLSDKEKENDELREKIYKLESKVTELQNKVALLENANQGTITTTDTHSVSNTLT